MLRNTAFIVFMVCSVELSCVGSVVAETSVPSTATPQNEGGYGIKQRFIEWMLTDKKFVQKAAEGGRAEIELSKLALQKAQEPHIKDFAQKMIDDHSVASLELNNIAQGKNYPLSLEMDSEHQKALLNLQAANGAQFDAMYIDVMKKDHEENITLFAAAAADKKLDSQLQSFAQKKLPILRSHLQHVHSLEATETLSGQ